MEICTNYCYYIYYWRIFWFQVCGKCVGCCASKDFWSSVACGGNKNDFWKVSAKKQIQDLSKEFLPKIIDIRRHLHSNPELSFQEIETSKYIKSYSIRLGDSFSGTYCRYRNCCIIKWEKS